MLRAMPFSFPRGGWLISMFDVSMSICQYVIRIRQIPPLPEGRDTPDPRPEVGAWSSQLPLLLLPLRNHTSIIGKGSTKIASPGLLTPFSPKVDIRHPPA